MVDYTTYHSIKNALDVIYYLCGVNLKGLADNAENFDPNILLILHPENPIPEPSKFIIECFCKWALDECSVMVMID